MAATAGLVWVTKTLFGEPSAWVRNVRRVPVKQRSVGMLRPDTRIAGSRRRATNKFYLTVCVCTYRLPSMNRPLSYDECNCFALRQAARHVTQIYERHLGDVGLTAAQFTILAKLARTPNLPMADLADAMVMERTTLVRTIQPLRRNGLLLSEVHGADARALSIALTAAGEARLKAARQHWDAAQAEFEHRFGEERAAALRGELLAITRDSI